jgi:hypothetical protein
VEEREGKGDKLDDAARTTEAGDKPSVSSLLSSRMSQQRAMSS